MREKRVDRRARPSNEQAQRWEYTYIRAPTGDNHSLPVMVVGGRGRDARCGSAGEDLRQQAVPLRRPSARAAFVYLEPR
jgi:hypothetical protein